jgi:CRISPR-associated exonuclease Cas4
VLTARQYNLTGKPDMIYAKKGTMIPIELKSGGIGQKEQPKDGDLMQLSAYFALVEAEWGIRPKEGRLIYHDAMFVVRNTRRLRKRLLQTLTDMENMLHNPDGAERDFNFIKCRRCLCRGTVCEGS